jgi:hypothetical protein
MPRMRARHPVLILTVLLLASFPACTMWKEKPVSAWSSATGGEHLEKLFWQSVKDKNYKELEKHLAPTFVAVGPEGTRDRAATLDHLKSMDLADFSMGDLSVQPVGGDMVVTYTLTVRGTINGQPLPTLPLHMMTVWQQVKAGHVAIAHSVSP